MGLILKGINYLVINKNRYQYFIINLFFRLLFKITLWVLKLTFDSKYEFDTLRKLKIEILKT